MFLGKKHNDYFQINEHFSFKLCAGKKLGKHLPKKDYFEKALYTFDIGQNDIASAFFSKSLDQIIASIPEILAEFETGIQVSLLTIVTI